MPRKARGKSEEGKKLRRCRCVELQGKFFIWDRLRTQVVATVFRFTGFPLPPLIIGFILGGMMEDNLGRAIRRSGGLEFLWERPMTLALVILALVLLVAPYLVDKLKIRDRLMSN